MSSKKKMINNLADENERLRRKYKALVENTKQLKLDLIRSRQLLCQAHDRLDAYERDAMLRMQDEQRIQRVRNSTDRERYEHTKRCIQKVIDSIIENKNINIKGFPDKLERRMYENLVIILIELVRTLCDTVDLHVLGHTIKLSIEPDALPPATAEKAQTADL